MDSVLEAFKHNPTYGSFSPLAAQLSENTKYLNQLFEVEDSALDWILAMSNLGRVHVSLATLLGRTITSLMVS
jgi:hypothetical protein